MKNILIFTEHSKKRGIGHLIRSERLYRNLRKSYNCKFFINKSDNFIKKTLKNIKNFNLVILDFKTYKKKYFLNKKNLFFIIFDQSRIKSKNLISINPLVLNTKKYNGTKWFVYPDNFFKKKRSKIYKKKMNLFISQGGTDSDNNLKKILKKINYCSNKISKVYIKIPKKNYLNKINNKKIVKLSSIKNLFNLLNKVDLAISGCGNFSYEINFFKIPTVYVSDVKDEILRGKRLENLKLGKFYRMRNLDNAFKELYKLMNDKNYYKKMVQFKQNFFAYNGLLNIKSLIKTIFLKYDF